MIEFLNRIGIRVFMPALLATFASATDMWVRIDGPISGGNIEFGLHDDYIGLETCGGTCFAPALFQVDVTCLASDSPVGVAQRIAAAILADGAAQTQGFLVTAGAAPGGGGMLRIQGPRNPNFRICVEFLLLSDHNGTCAGGATTPGGNFNLIAGGAFAVPTIGEWGLALLTGLLLAVGVVQLRNRSGQLPTA